MAGYGSSALSKSTKKLAPKAPPQRRKNNPTALELENSGATGRPHTSVASQSSIDAGTQKQPSSTSRSIESSPLVPADGIHSVITHENRGADPSIQDNERAQPEATNARQKRKADEITDNATRAVISSNNVESDINGLHKSQKRTVGQSPNQSANVPLSTSTLEDSIQLLDPRIRTDTTALTPHGPVSVDHGAGIIPSISHEPSNVSTISGAEDTTDTGSLSRGPLVAPTKPTRRKATQANAYRRARTRSSRLSIAQSSPTNELEINDAGPSEVHRATADDTNPLAVDNDGAYASTADNGVTEIRNTLKRAPVKPVTKRRTRGRPRKDPTSQQSADRDVNGTDQRGQQTTSISSVTLAGSSEIVPTDSPHNVDTSPSPSSRAARRNKRDETPENAANYEIDSEKVTMDDLCKPSKLGKKSQLESELQSIDWSEIAKKRKAEKALALQKLEDAKRGIRETEDTEDQGTGTPEENHQARGPQLRLVNGEIIIDNSSLALDSHAAAMARGRFSGEAIEETNLTKRVNNRTWLYDNKRDPVERHPDVGKGARWRVEETNQFYEAIRRFGTDFLMISKMFPGRTRNHIKRKFTREEKEDPGRVQEALSNAKPIEMDYFCEATGREEEDFKDPRLLDGELKEAEDKQRAEIEEQKRQAAENARRKQEAAREKARQAEERKSKRQRKRNQVGGADGDANT